MAWDSTKTDNVSTLPASEYNAMVTYIKALPTSVSSSGSGDNIYLTVGMTGSSSDYTCDGSADQVQINQAIVAANAMTGGGTVFIKGGNYKTSGTITMLSNVNLVGEGWNTNIQMNGAGSSALISTTGKSYFSIKNMVCDHYQTNKTGGTNIYMDENCHDYVIEGVYAKNGYSNNILAGGYNILLRGCVSDYCKIADGILFYPAHDAAMVNCISCNTQAVTGNGIATYSGDNSAEHVTITNCIAHNNVGLGIQIERAKNVVVSNCVSYDNTGSNYGVNGTGAYKPYNVSFIGCHSDNSGETGYTINYGEKVIIANCISDGDAQDGVKIGGSGAATEITVTGCHMRNITGAGIRCYNTSSSTIGYVFSNNVITSTTGYGIEAGDAYGVIISGNKISSTSKGILSSGQRAVITGNIVNTGAGQYTSGISIDSSTGVESIISNNYVASAGQYGINTEASNVIISGNIVKNSGQYGTNAPGIRVATNRTHVNVSNNISFDDQGTHTQSYGIYIGAGSDYITLNGNDCYGNVSGSVYGSVGANGKDDAYYLLNSAVDSAVGLTLTGDNSSADTAYVPMVLYNTDATPPTASTVPVGTIYVQYTP